MRRSAGPREQRAPVARVAGSAAGRGNAVPGPRKTATCGAAGAATTPAASVFRLGPMLNARAWPPDLTVAHAAHRGLRACCNGTTSTAAVARDLYHVQGRWVNHAAFWSATPSALFKHYFGVSFDTTEHHLIGAQLL